MMDTIKGGIKAKFMWTLIKKKGFETFMKEVDTKPILKFPTFNEPFL